jgi:colanic acid/amylovoran biosynthesis protein
MKAIILNTDSLLNPGDAAIVLAQIRLLRRLRPGLSIALTSRTPALDARFFEPLGVSVHPALLPAPSLWHGPGRKIAGSLRHALRIGAAVRLVRAIRGSDFVVSCGGGPFYSNRRRRPGLTFAQNVLHVRLAQAFGKPVLFFPQSFGPFGSPAARRTVARLLAHRRTSRILVREERSLETVTRMIPARLQARIEPCPDLAFLLSPEPAGRPNPIVQAMPRPRLAVTVRDWDFPEAAGAPERRRMRDRYLEAVATAALRFALEHGGGVFIVPHTRGPGDFEDDRIVSRRLFDRLKADLPADRLALLEIPDTASPLDLVSLYGQADLVLATRTHAAVFGLLAGRPVVSIHYQPKGREIMASLGLDGLSLPIAELEAESLRSAMQAAAGRSETEAARIAGRIAAFRVEIQARIGRALDEVAGPQ